jgi:hypothetical protein
MAGRAPARAPVTEDAITDSALTSLLDHSATLQRDVLHLHALPLHGVLVRACKAFKSVIVYEKDRAVVSFYRAIVGGEWRPSDARDEKTDDRQRGFLKMSDAAERLASVAPHTHRANETNTWLSSVRECANSICWWDTGTLVETSAAQLDASVLLLTQSDHARTSARLHAARRPVCVWARSRPSHRAVHLPCKSRGATDEDACKLYLLAEGENAPIAAKKSPKKEKEKPKKTEQKQQARESGAITEKTPERKVENHVARMRPFPGPHNAIGEPPRPIFTQQRLSF